MPFPSNPVQPQAVASTYVWGDLFDFQRRKGADAAAFSDPDRLMIVRLVSSTMYKKYLWPFTLATTPLGSIPCVNGQQDYPQPSDMYTLSRAWFYVPTNANVQNNSYGPYDDPSALAAQSVAASVAYVNAQANGGGTPAGLTYPLDGSLNVVKRLPQNLLMATYTGIRSICQQPNVNYVRLDWATAVSDSQPFSLEMEYQLSRPIINTLDERCWFPDDYVRMAEEGILYELYKYTNDSRAGAVSMVTGRAAYSGQLAVWMDAMEATAQAERAGSVDVITPQQSLGADYGTWGGWWA